MTTRIISALAAAATLGLAALTAGPAVADITLGPDLVHFDGPASNLGGFMQVSRAGDVNGDGYDDLAVGFPLASPHNRTWAGSVFIVFGGPHPTGGQLAGSSAIRIDGDVGNGLLGRALTSGDFNHDGYEDLAIGSDALTYQTRANAGQVVVVKGGPAMTSIDLALISPTPRWWLIGGAKDDDRMGTAMVGGDVTGDGIDDLVLGSPNPSNYAGVTVVRGGSAFGDLDLQTISTAIRLTGASDVGSQLSLGDVTGDAVMDVLIGAELNHSPGQSHGFVVRGGSGLVSAGLVDTSPGVFMVDTTGLSAYMGPMNAVDMDGDGHPDLVVGTYSPGSRDSSVRVLARHPVAASLKLVDVSGQTRFVGTLDEAFGVSVASPGDLDRDGYGDLVVGAPGSADGKGAAYVLRGSAVLSGAVIPDVGAVGYRVNGPGGVDALTKPYAGFAVAGVGDFNGDGGQDLAIAAPGADTAGVDSGAVYVVFGPPPGPPVTVTPAATLRVSARAATKPIPRMGRVKLVRGVVVGPGQSASIRVTRTPKKLRKRSRVTRTATTVRIRTKHAPKGKVSVRITASGSGVTPVTWSRSWRVK